jgi:hypothetical protein
MSLTDPDLNEWHLSVMNALTGQPYVDAGTGWVSLDLPYETAELQEFMYVPRNAQMSALRVVMPSLLAMPELRGLLSQINYGDRFELYDFQPDCGDPRFGGYLNPGGISADTGRVVYDVLDSPSSLRWQRARKYEGMNALSTALYARALSRWRDIVNEDWTT